MRKTASSAASLTWMGSSSRREGTRGGGARRPPRLLRRRLPNTLRASCSLLHRMKSTNLPRSTPRSSMSSSRFLWTCPGSAPEGPNTATLAPLPKARIEGLQMGSYLSYTRNQPGALQHTLPWVALPRTHSLLASPDTHSQATHTLQPRVLPPPPLESNTQCTDPPYTPVEVELTTRTLLSSHSSPAFGLWALFQYSLAFLLPFFRLVFIVSLPQLGASWLLFFLQTQAWLQVAQGLLLQ